MGKILTIIIPTYNMEDYLQKCLSSLIVDDEELMNLLDVIVVNDGSTDCSSEIAHRYEAEYPGVFRVIDKENGNYGSCVNRGLKEAKGKYVKTLDADDWFETDNFREYLQLLQNTDADAVLNFAQIVHPDGTRGGNCGLSLQHFRENANGKTKFNLDYIAERKELHPQMHNLTYKMDLFKKMNYRQIEGVFYSDTQWRIVPMAFVDTIEVFPHVLYIYLLGRSGQSVAPNVQRQYFEHEMLLVKQLYHEYYNCNSNQLGRKYIDSCLEGHLKYLYCWGINDEVFNEIDIRKMDSMVRALEPKIWQEMKGWKVRISKYRHSVTVGFWRKWDGRWFYLLEGALGFFWDPYKKVKAWLKK